MFPDVRLPRVSIDDLRVYYQPRIPKVPTKTQFGTRLYSTNAVNLDYRKVEIVKNLDDRKIEMVKSSITGEVKVDVSNWCQRPTSTHCTF